MMLVVYYIITVILTKELVMATDEHCGVYRFKSPFFPGESCEDIYNMNPESRDRPGYYWVATNDVFCGMNYSGSSCEDIYNNNPETGDKSGYYRINDTQWTYCDMIPITCSAGDAGVGEGWTRVVNIDVSAGDDCPSGWRKDTQSGISFCSPNSDTSGRDLCFPTNFSTNGISYQRVCGRARGYQKGITHSFHAYHFYNGRLTVNDAYVDGLSITYGNPRRHIWTYSVGRYDNFTDTNANCPCAGGQAPPPFVGTDYYCESGAADTIDGSAYFFNDPLWDGSGCITSTCCATPTQPWFYRELSAATTGDIEARICVGTLFNRNVLVDQLELYIH